MPSKPSLLLTGLPAFIDRHSALFQSFERQFDVTTVPLMTSSDDILTRLRRRVRRHLGREPEKTEQFKTDSKTIRRQIERLNGTFDHHLHVFCTFSPFVEVHHFSRRRFLLLDYTMELAVRNWRPWGSFVSPQAQADWLRLERETYTSADKIFAFSETVAESLRNDYSINAHKIAVVGNSVEQTEQLPRTLPSLITLIHDGSDPYRKGTDRCIDFLRTSKSNGLEARLTVVGSNQKFGEPSVENAGIISDKMLMSRKLGESAFAFAPARCDPFPTFVLEALAHGTPAFVTKESGLSYVVREICSDLIYDPERPGLTVDYIKNLIEQPERYEDLSSRFLQYSRLNFSTEFVSSKIARDILASDETQP